MSRVVIDRATVEQAQQAEPTGKQLLQVESVAAVAENATTQQRVVEAPPSDYRRGYWDGFNIGKRKGRIEAEDAQQQAEPDHETRAELAEQQVVQLTEERDHFRNLWQKAQQAEPAREWVSMDEYKRLQGLVTSQGIRLMEYESKQPQQAEPAQGPITRLFGTLPVHDTQQALAHQAEPHPDYPCRSDGRCQYAIDHGAEGLGSCPKGKCAIAQPQPAEDRAVAQDNLRVMREMFGEQAEPDLSRCPQCNGPADNGFDRSIPPSPYLCTKCMAEPVEPVAWMVYTEDGKSVCVTDNPNDLVGACRALPLYTAPPQRKPLTEEEIRRIIACIDKFTTVREGMRQLARAVERAHGIGETK